MEHKIVLHKDSAALNTGTVSSAILTSATLKNVISNSKTLNQCNIK